MLKLRILTAPHNILSMPRISQTHPGLNQYLQMKYAEINLQKSPHLIFCMISSNEFALSMTAENKLTCGVPNQYGQA